MCETKTADWKEKVKTIGIGYHQYTVYNARLDLFISCSINSKSHFVVLINYLTLMGEWIMEWIGTKTCDTTLEKPVVLSDNFEVKVG